MLSNKYIKQFYQFTQQSINGNASGNGTQSRCFLFGLGLTLLIALAIGIAVNSLPRVGGDPSSMRSKGHAKNESAPLRGRQQDQRGSQQAIQTKEPKRISMIPMCRTAAKQQTLQPASLRKADQIVLNEEDFSSEPWVVMDKVVVIPKIIG